MKLTPPKRPERKFVVSINASGRWGVDPAIESDIPSQALAFQVEQQISYRGGDALTVGVTIEVVVSAASVHQAVARGVERVNGWPQFYSGWLDDASAFEVSARYEQGL